MDVYKQEKEDYFLINHDCAVEKLFMNSLSKHGTTSKNVCVVQRKFSAKS